MILRQAARAGKDSTVNVVLFMRLVPRWPVCVVASRLLLGPHRGPMTTNSLILPVPLSCPVSSVVSPERPRAYRDHVSHRAHLLCSWILGIAGCSHDVSSHSSSTTSSQSLFHLRVQFLRRWFLNYRGLTGTCLGSRSSLCHRIDQFLVDAIVGVQGFVTSWRLMWRRTQGHCFRCRVTPAG